MPSTTSTVWVTMGGTASARPAIAAIPVATRAPEMSPPGRFAHKNSSPPAVPMPSVSSAVRTLVPTFRSSRSVAAPTFTNFEKLRALANSLIPAQLFYLKFLARIRRL